MRWPDEQTGRRLLAEIGRRMYDKDFVAANDGNISLKIADDMILTTPRFTTASG